METTTYTVCVFVIDRSPTCVHAVIIAALLHYKLSIFCCVKVSEVLDNGHGLRHDNFSFPQAPPAAIRHFLLLKINQFWGLYNGAKARQVVSSGSRRNAPKPSVTLSSKRLRCKRRAWALFWPQSVHVALFRREPLPISPPPGDAG